MAISNAPSNQEITDAHKFNRFLNTLEKQFLQEDLAQAKVQLVQVTQENSELKEALHLSHHSKGASDTASEEIIQRQHAEIKESNQRSTELEQSNQALHGFRNASDTVETEHASRQHRFGGTANLFSQPTAATPNTQSDQPAVSARGFSKTQGNE